MSSSMNAFAILADLTAAGFALRAEGDRLIVTPGHRITGPIRELIRRHKPELLALVRESQRLTTDDQEVIAEATAERATIMEFDGGLPRREAETLAKRAMRVFRYRLCERPSCWLTLLAPGCDLAQARAALASQFGEFRVLDVLEASHD